MSWWRMDFWNQNPPNYRNTNRIKRKKMIFLFETDKNVETVGQQCEEQTIS